LTRTLAVVYDKEVKEYQKGQILLIIILVMTVALTIGLSVATRTIMNIRTSADEESSQRAFSAAEAGIEQSLQNSNSTSGQFGNNTSYQTTISTVAGTGFLLNNGAPILKDNPVDVWLAAYPNLTTPWTGAVTIYWGSSSDNCATNEATNSMAALEVVLITGTKNNPRLMNYPIDPCQARANVNRFDYNSIATNNTTFQGKTYGFRKSIEITNGLLLRIIPLYAPTRAAITSCTCDGAAIANLPAQGTLVTSTGSSGETQRKITGFKENPKLPVQLFPFVIFSPK
jgi:hypothetical protein